MCDRQIMTNESCQEFRGQTVLQIKAVHNLRKVRMYLNVLSLAKGNLEKGILKKFKIDYSDFLVKS